jgi:hypothetical protein
MTSLGRTYVAAATMLVFFVLWAAIAARPWATPTADPRAEALVRREAVVRRAAQQAQEAYTARWDRYRRELAARRSQPTVTAAAPPVRIVQLPPVATTRSS